MKNLVGGGGESHKQGVQLWSRRKWWIKFENEPQQIISKSAEQTKKSTNIASS